MKLCPPIASKSPIAVTGTKRWITRARGHSVQREFGVYTAVERACFADR